MRKNVFYILAYAFCLAGCNDAPSFEEEGVPQIKVSQIMFNIHIQYLQPIITQYFIDNKSEIWLLFLIAHSKR